MNYLLFIKSQLAGKYVVVEDGFLHISYTSNGFFHIISDRSSNISEHFTIEELRFVVKLISQCFGKNNYSYRAWNTILQSALKILYTL